MHRRVRLLCPLTALALLLPAGPAAADHVTARPIETACPENQVRLADYVDVPNPSQFELAVSCLAEYGITRGRTPTSYDPVAPVLRQQMALFLFRLGSRAGVQWDTGDTGYTDLSGSTPEVREAINALTNAGVAQGRSPQVFDPLGLVTRGQMASFLARLADVAGAAGFVAREDAFDDDEELVHEAGIDRIAAAGVTAGRGQDRFFDPFSAVNRQQMALFLARTLDVFVGQDLAQSLHRSDVAPVTLTVDQTGEVVEPGAELTGRVEGDGVAGLYLYLPASTFEADDPGDSGRLEFALRTDRQEIEGYNRLYYEIELDNGRVRRGTLPIVFAGFTDRPELEHVERVGTSAASGFDTSEVRFLFDADVTVGTPDPEQVPFLLVTYRKILRATAVRQDGSHAVIATFGTTEQPVGPGELREVSYAAALQGAALDDQGRPVPAGTALLNPGSLDHIPHSSDAYSGPTWQADLLSVTDRRPDPERAGRFLVDFVFDARLDLPGLEGGQQVFDVVLVDGTGRRCDRLDPAPRSRVTVSCDGADAAGPGGTIARGVLSRRSGETEQPLATTLLLRRPTPAPDIASVERGPGSNQVTVEFDEPVHVGPAERFFVAGPVERSPALVQDATAHASDARRVVVTLQPLSEGTETSLLVRGGAVTSRATGRTNVVEQAAMPAVSSYDMPAGYTLGRDLRSIRTTAEGRAFFDFDEAVFPADDVYSPDVDLRLYLPDGTELVCTSVGYQYGEGGAYGTSVPCNAFSVGDRPATVEQVQQATYGAGRYDSVPGGMPVDGARR